MLDGQKSAVFGGGGELNRPCRARLTIAAVVAALAAVSLAACGDASEDTATPGFDASPEAVDQSPFELAKPTTTEGPTTIPGDIASGRPVDIPSLATTTTAIITTTTTTTPISQPELPEPVQIDSLCGMSRALQSFGLIVSTPGLDIAAYVTDVRRNLARYVEIAPPGLRGTVESVAAVVNGLVDLGADADYRTDDPSLQRAISDAAAGSGSYGGFPAQVNTIYRHEQATC